MSDNPVCHHPTCSDDPFVALKAMAYAYVYIMASQKNGTLYIGVTRDIASRVHDHKIKADRKSFTAQYDVNRLVWFEDFDDIQEAIQREKRLKKYNRQWKINLIEEHNPTWRELDPLTGMFL